MINITQKQNCCGCTACMSVCPKKCITITKDKEGFGYPVVDLALCIDCGLCERVCPILNYVSQDNKPDVYGIINKDDTAINESTSGGAFWGLVQYVIGKHGVVYGAVFDEKFNVIHQRENTLEECKKFHGAKYVESYIGKDIFANVKKDLDCGIITLFSGTPCQISGLKNYLRKDYENLITVDLVCSSVPSPKIYAEFLSFVSQKKKIDKINMRWKGNGWLKTRQKFTYKDKTSEIGTGYARLWHTIAFSHLVSRPSCHACKFTNFNRIGDFTIGDYWGVENVFPDIDNQKGVSLMMVNTSKGKTIFENIKNYYWIFDSDCSKCLQPRLVSPVSANKKRTEFWNDYDKMSFEQLARKYWNYGFWNQLFFDLRKIAGRFYHSILKK